MTQDEPARQVASLPADQRALRSQIVRAIAAGGIMIALAFALRSRVEGIVPHAGEIALAMLAVQPFIALVLVIQGAVTRMLAGASVTLLHGIKAMALGAIGFLLLPGRMSEGLKPLYLASVSGLPLPRGASVLLVERFIDVICVALLILLTLSLTGSSPVIDHALLLLGTLAVAGVIGLGIVIWAPKIMDRLIERLPWASLRTMAQQLVAAMRETVAPKRLIAAGMFAILTWCCSYALFYTFLKLAASLPLTAAEILTVFTLSTIGLAVAVAPGGLGTFEAAMSLGLVHHGFALPESLMLAICIRLANIALPAGIVAWMVLRDDASVARLLQNVRGPR